MTGATGFLGKYVVEDLMKAGHDLVCFGRNKAALKAFEEKKITSVNGDFTNLKEISDACKDVDAVIHCGALSTVWGKWEDFYNSNVKGTENVIEACIKNGVKRLVYISSPSIYTEAKNKFLISEEDIVENNELNHYIKSKILAEKLVNAVEDEILETVIIRPRGLFGIGDTSIIPRIINANKKIGVPLLNGGQNIVDVTYVGNVSKSIELAVLSEKAKGNTYNITNGEPMAFKDIMEILFDELGYEPRFRNMNLKMLYFAASLLEKVYKFFGILKEPILTKYTVITLGYSQTLDISKAKEDLAYEPIYTIREGAKIYGKALRD